MMLEMDKVCAAYGPSQVLHEVSLKIHDQEIVTIIGSNGAGKSTILKTICGWLGTTSGQIQFAGERIDNNETKDIVRKGISISPEGRRVFPKLTVLENLEMGAYVCTKREFEEEVERVYQIFPKLKERTKQLASSLSGGEQQMLAIGRAVMSKPKLLLLDEPSLGLAPVMIDTVLEAIKIIKESGVTICLVEQNAQLALEIADRGYVLETGKIVLEGMGRELLRNEKVKNAYLGL